MQYTVWFNEPTAKQLLQDSLPQVQQKPMLTLWLDTDSLTQWWLFDSTLNSRLYEAKEQLPKPVYRNSSDNVNIEKDKDEEKWQRRRRGRRRRRSTGKDDTGLILWYQTNSTEYPAWLTAVSAYLTTRWTVPPVWTSTSSQPMVSVNIHFTIRTGANILIYTTLCHVLKQHL